MFILCLQGAAPDALSPPTFRPILILFLVVRLFFLILLLYTIVLKLPPCEYAANYLRIAHPVIPL